MQYIKHRVNRTVDLATVHPDWGVEIDLRSDVTRHGAIHLAHDAWAPGDDFAAWLKVYAARGVKGPLILNTKEDGLEARALELVKAHGISNYFFLDTQLPTLVARAVRHGEAHYAVRLSQYEPPVLAEVFTGKVTWVWIDCFGVEPMPVADAARLKPFFDLCLVSPELQGGKADSDHLRRFADLYRIADAICTKDPEAWQGEFGV